MREIIKFYLFFQMLTLTEWNSFQFRVAFLVQFWLEVRGFAFARLPTPFQTFAPSRKVALARRESWKLI